MSTASIEQFDPASLPIEKRNALAILAHLPVDEMTRLKAVLHLGNPGVVGLTTLNTFFEFCTGSKIGLDLSEQGVNAFKLAHELGNTGPIAGMIGGQTAAVYFDVIMQRLNGSIGSGQQRSVNRAGLDLIKEFEGYAKIVPNTTNVTAYLDPVGIPTIGYGHTGPDVVMGDIISQAQAETSLERDLQASAAAVQRLVTVPLNDNEFSALVSFTYNLGGGTLAESTLLRLLNGGDRTNAANEVLRFTHAGGRVLSGLAHRRQAEQALFLAT